MIGAIQLKAGVRAEQIFRAPDRFNERVLYELGPIKLVTSTASPDMPNPYDTPKTQTDPSPSAETASSTSTVPSSNQAIEASPQPQPEVPQQQQQKQQSKSRPL